jgi:hypothetical protein
MYVTLFSIILVIGLLLLLLPINILGVCETPKAA